MSTLMFATTCLSGTVGCSTQYFEPSSPASSPSQKANKIDRRGAWGNFANAAMASQQPRHTAGVVISTVVNVAGRTVAIAGIAITDVIVVRPDQDVLIL